MKGTELVLQALRDRGVQYIFGYTGGAIMPVFDEMEKQQGFKFVMPRQEQGATFMAQGLSRASLSTDTPQIGVCMATSGPGAMNLVTGVADAHMDSVPIVAITGQVATGVIATDAFQESDVVGVMMPICKQTYMPLSAEEIEKTIHEAFYVATTGRPGPVVIDIPKDIQFAETGQNYSFDPKKFRPKLPGFYYHPTPQRDVVHKAVEMLNRSERPVMFCGHGVIASNAGALLQEFAEKSNIPVAFTLHGLSAMPLDHPLSLGMMGMHGTVEANRAVMNADLILSFGMRFDDRVTGKLNEYAANADVIHVEIDPSELDKNVATTVAINADVYRTLHVMLSDPELIHKPRRRWLQEIDNNRQETAGVEEEIAKGVGDAGKLLMKTVMRRLSDITGGKDIIVPDVGQHQMMAARFYNYQTNNSWFASGGAGTMGCSLPMAIGAKLARPDERVGRTVRLALRTGFRIGKQQRSDRRRHATRSHGQSSAAHQRAIDGTWLRRLKRWRVLSNSSPHLHPGHAQRTLSLNSPGGITAHEVLRFGYGYTVEVTGDRVLQAACRYGEVERLLTILIQCQPCNQS